MRGESMKGKSKKSTYSTTFGVDPKKSAFLFALFGNAMVGILGLEPRTLCV